MGKRPQLTIAHPQGLALIERIDAVYEKSQRVVPCKCLLAEKQR